MRVFLSYRRGDSAGHAGRLHDELTKRLGADHVFQDVSSIGPGEHFPQVVEQAITRADVVLAVIGPRWATVKDAQGVLRLKDPEDYVRLELETAFGLERRVVPVLVDGAPLPGREVLPITLAPMIERQAVALRDESWGYDVDRLWEALGDPGSEASSRRRSPRLVAIGAALVAVALAGWLFFATRDNGTSSETTSGVETSDPTGTEPTGATQPLSSAPPARVAQGSDGDLVYQVQKWWKVAAQPEGAQLVTVRLKVANDTNQTQSIYDGRFELRAGGVSQGKPSAVLLDGTGTLAPDSGEASIVLVRFELLSDDTPVELLVFGEPDSRQATLTLGSG